MSLRTIHFLDIESVPQFENIPDNELGDLFRHRFRYEIEKLQQDARQMVSTSDIDFANAIWKQKAGLFAEFGKVVCGSVGKMQETKFYVKTVIDKDEKVVLRGIAAALEKAVKIGGHNIKEFDVPFLTRRFIINGLPVPAVLQIDGKKTWDYPFEDSMEKWSGTQWKYLCSLELLAVSLGIPSPKKVITGADIASLWFSIQTPPDGVLVFDHEEKIFAKIKTYCAGDVVTAAQVYAAIKAIPGIPTEADSITHV